MAVFKWIDISNNVPRGKSIEFRRVRVRSDAQSPVLLVEYAKDGQVQDAGLWLDIGKRAFIDHLQDSAQEMVARNAVESIIEAVYPAHKNANASVIAS